MAQVKIFSTGGIGHPCCCSGTTHHCVITICVQGCTGGSLSGAVVTIKFGGTTVATCTTNGGGCCTVDVHDADTYEVTVSHAGYYTYRASRALTCNSTINIKLKLTTGAVPVEFDVTGCC